MNPNQDYQSSQGTYQTGSTCPPKNRGGVVALVLVLVIFLCGVSTILGFFDIPLTVPVIQPEPENSPFSVTRNRIDANTDDIPFDLGFSGQEVPELWCLYQDLPQGIYITDVADHSDAAIQGVLPGDILLSVDGENITSAEQLSALLENKHKPVQVALYRDGKQRKLTLKLLDN